MSHFVGVLRTCVEIKKFYGAFVLNHPDALVDFHTAPDVSDGLFDQLAEALEHRRPEPLRAGRVARDGAVHGRHDGGHTDRCGGGRDAVAREAEHDGAARFLRRFRRHGCTHCALAQCALALSRWLRGVALESPWRAPSGEWSAQSCH